MGKKSSNSQYTPFFKPYIFVKRFNDLTNKSQVMDMTARRIVYKCYCWNQFHDFHEDPFFLNQIKMEKVRYLCSLSYYSSLR